MDEYRERLREHAKHADNPYNEYSKLEADKFHKAYTGEVNKMQLLNKKNKER